MAMPPEKMPAEEAEPMPGFGGGEQKTLQGPGPDTNVTPEEQQQYNLFVTRCLDAVSSDKKLQNAMLDMAEAAPTPVDGLGQCAATLVMRVEDSARDNGIEVSGDVLLHGGMEVTEALAEFIEAKTDMEFSEEDIEGAFYKAVDLYRADRQQKGLLDKEAADSDWNDLQQASQTGGLEQIVPGIEQEAAKRLQKAPKGEVSADEAEAEEDAGEPVPEEE